MEKAVGSIFQNHCSIGNSFQKADYPGDITLDEAADPLEWRIAKPDEFSAGNAYITNNYELCGRAGVRNKDES